MPKGGDPRYSGWEVKPFDPKIPSQSSLDFVGSSFASGGAKKKKTTTTQKKPKSVKPTKKK
tara:strand:+ start:1839 stop:2021 length:183 start_codon:yes stop_codon:yes gene_type:complete